MLRAYKYRLYPTADQAEFFSKSFGCCRVAYNRTLDYISMLWCGVGVSVSRFGAQEQLTSLKDIYPWFGEGNSQSLQYTVKQVADGFRNWWEHRAIHPLPKRKKDREPFHNPQSCSVDWKRRTLSIPKCKDIPIVLHRSFYGKIKDVTISMDPDGKHYTSILVDTAISEKPCGQVEQSTTIGIDTGVKTFAVCSDGREFTTPHFAKAAEKRLKHYQRELRHKTKGSPTARASSSTAENPSAPASSGPNPDLCVPVAKLNHLLHLEQVTFCNVLNSNGLRVTTCALAGLSP